MVGMSLEPNAHPATTVRRATVAASRHGIGEHEKRGGVPASRPQLLGQLSELVLEHRFEALAADIVLRRAIQAIADRHVVRRDGLGDTGGGGADREEPPRHFLTAADLGKRPVRRGIEIERQGLLLCGERGVDHGYQIRGMGLRRNRFAARTVNSASTTSCASRNGGSVCWGASACSADTFRNAWTAATKTLR